jgi:hypothetical protein
MDSVNRRAVSSAEVLVALLRCLPGSLILEAHGSLDDLQRLSRLSGYFHMDAGIADLMLELLEIASLCLLPLADDEDAPLGFAAVTSWPRNGTAP